MQWECCSVGVLLDQPFDPQLRFLLFAVYGRGQNLKHNLVPLGVREKRIWVIAAQKPATDKGAKCDEPTYTTQTRELTVMNPHTQHKQGS